MIEMSKFYSMHKYLKTRAATRVFLEELAEIEENSYRSTAGLAKLREISEKHSKLISDIGIDITKKTYLDEIKKYLSSIEFMRLSLAFIPSDRFLEKMQAVLVNIIGFPPVFDVYMDQGILGGATIDYNGKHVDLSFKKSLEKYFVENRNALLSEL